MSYNFFKKMQNALTTNMIVFSNSHNTINFTYITASNQGNNHLTTVQLFLYII